MADEVNISYDIEVRSIFMGRNLIEVMCGSAFYELEGARL